MVEAVRRQNQRSAGGGVSCLDQIFVLSPINGTAASVTSQAGCGDLEDLGRDELVGLIAEIKKRRDVLASKLGLDTKAKRRNFMWKMNKEKRQYRSAICPELAEEYWRLGHTAAAMSGLLADMKNKAKGVA